MEPNKTEKIIKSRLESREIQPSENAWDRLDAMLSVEEKPKQKVAYWKYIAASIVLFLGLTFWYNQISEAETIIENQPVTTIVEETVQPKENPIIENNEIEEIVEIKNHQVVERTKTISKIKNQKSNSSNKIASQPEIIVEKVFTDNQKQITDNKQQATNNKYISAEKLLASVENKDLENSSIQNVTIETPKKSFVKVNPDELLSVVEEEINQEYCETTFDKIKRKFNETKTAVVNRNYE